MVSQPSATPTATPMPSSATLNIDAEIQRISQAIDIAFAVAPIERSKLNAYIHTESKYLATTAKRLQDLSTRLSDQLTELYKELLGPTRGGDLDSKVRAQIEDAMEFAHLREEMMSRSGIRK